MTRRKLGRIVRLLDGLLAQDGKDRQLAATALERLGFPAVSCHRLRERNPHSLGSQNMNRVKLSASFGLAGFLVGWFTRPLVETRGSSVAAHELLSHLRGDLDPFLADAAHKTWLHLSLFGLSCMFLGYVLARLMSPD